MIIIIVAKIKQKVAARRQLFLRETSDLGLFVIVMSSGIFLLFPVLSLYTRKKTDPFFFRTERTNAKVSGPGHSRSLAYFHLV